MTESKLRIRKTKRYDDEVIYAAKFLYLKQYTPKEIAAELGLNSTRPIYYWAEKYQWRNLISENGIEELIALRIITLTERENKSDQEIKELEALIDKDLQYKKQRAVSVAKAKSAVEMRDVSAGASGGFADSGDGQPERKRKGPVKNDISHITPEMCQPFIDSLFGYQKHLRNNKHHDIRNLLKSRQIGATYYFSFEALEDAIFSGDNQIFLSASKRQAEIFKTYIIKMARQYFNVELKGNPIILSNGAELHFLSTNKNTSQGNSGHVYGDEYAWLRDFQRFNDVASAMATHAKWRETYFTTPSSKFHESYAFWSGESWKEGDPKRKNVVFPSFDEMRDGGRLCPDGQWRYVVTIEDALKGGADTLFNIEKLKLRYNKYAFNQLYMCVWIDDADSIFTIKELLKCGVDITKWKDFDPKADRPFGNREVWGGYDPAQTGDGASFVIVAPPAIEGELYRVLARYQWHGLSYRYQANQIKQLFEKYNMTYIGIDATGVGLAVYENIKEFARRAAVPIVYNPDSKSEMVLKVHDLVEHNLLQWDQNELDIVPSFLMIKHQSTKSGNTMTFTAERTVKTQHADVFFAICNAINRKSLTDKPRRKGRGWRIN